MTVRSVNADDAAMTYAVVLSENESPGTAGRLDLESDSFHFSDGTRVRYADLRDMYLERRPNKPPSLVVHQRQGQALRVVSLEGLGALHELAEELFEGREKASA
jgi:hypothetical protein